MIVPGKSVNNIVIGSNIADYPDAQYHSDLSLNQVLYTLNNGIKLRVDFNKEVCWISIDNKEPNISFKGIKIGATFNEIITQFNLTFDDDEGHFQIEGVNGFCFGFGESNSNLEDIISKNMSIKYFLIYDVNIDEHSKFWFDTKITNENLNEYF